MLEDHDAVGEWWALVPPTLLAIPVLFVMTVLFAGLGPGRPLAALPMVVLAFVCTWVVAAGDLFWPLVIAPDGGRGPAPLVIWAAARDGTEPPIGLSGPVPLLVLLVAVLALAQLFYLDRVRLRTGPADREDLAP